MKVACPFNRVLSKSVIDREIHGRITEVPDIHEGLEHRNDNVTTL